MWRKLSPFICLPCLAATSFSGFADPLKDQLTRQSHPEQQSASSDVKFDTNALNALGYGPEVADFFSKSNQFLPGKYDITITVNGSKQYTSNVTVGAQGQLCADEALTTLLKLKSPREKIEDSCPSLDALYPGTKITVYPNTFSVDILIAENDFDPLLIGNELTQGGFALLNNYRVYGMRMSGFDTQQFYQGQFETGINWNNWVIRNHSSFSSGKNNTQYEFNETVVRKNIQNLGSQLEFGQINMQGNLFGGTPLTGGQLYSDSSFSKSNQLVVPISGIAETPATVEVSQNGRLLYRTLIPAGPFKLDRINNIVSGQPVVVSVIQDDGQKQQFSVTTNTLNDAVTPSAYQAALGRYRTRNSGDYIEKPWLASIQGNFYYNETEYSVGTLMAEKYHSLGINSSNSWGKEKRTTSNLGGFFSYAPQYKGGQLNASVNSSTGPISIGFSSLYQTKNYLTLDESLYQNQTWQDDIMEDDIPRYWEGKIQSSSSVSANWALTNVGRLGYSLSYNHYYGQATDSIIHTLNYSKKISDINLTLSYQARNDRDNRFFANVSIPFNKKTSLSAQLQHYQNENTITSTVNYSANDFRHYSVGIGKTENYQRVNGSTSIKTAYTQFSANGSITDDQTSSLMLTASGALVYSGGKLATSSVALGDTFGILHIPKQSGVSVNSMGGGTALTNYFGTAVIPTLPVNRKTTVQMSTENLPLNVRLDTTSFDVAVAHGTVINKVVNANVMKQLLLSINMLDGTPASIGASVLNEKGELLGVVLAGGSVMLTNEQIGKKLILRIPNQGDCIVDYPVPEYFDPNSLYEEAVGLCRH